MPPQNPPYPTIRVSGPQPLTPPSFPKQGTPSSQNPPQVIRAQTVSGATLLKSKQTFTTNLQQALNLGTGASNLIAASIVPDELTALEGSWATMYFIGNTTSVNARDAFQLSLNKGYVRNLVALTAGTTSGLVESLSWYGNLPIQDLTGQSNPSPAVIFECENNSGSSQIVDLSVIFQ